MDQQHDALTGLLNRRSMWTAAPWLTPLAPDAALVSLDVIGLHAINAEFGHAFGDRLLAETAHRVQRVAGDCPVWRVGGDEFVIATRVAGADDVRRFARHLRVAIEEPLDGTIVGVWMGAAIVSPRSQGVDDLWQRADGALYRAMHQRTRDVVIDPDDTSDSAPQPPWQ
jgi:diguanylate cyclase (GGDEF)-like protein